MYGICNLSLVPCRKEASHRSEMVSQLLFGETFEILEQADGWIRIRIEFDGYECWIQGSQFQSIDKENYKKLAAADPALSGGLVELISKKSDPVIFPIVLGSGLPAFKKDTCELGNQEYLFEGTVAPAPDKENLRASIAETAYMYLNAPYLWGGRSPFGIDCSGFTQMVYKLNRLRIKRDAHQQAIQGTALSFVEESEEGDLAFFDNEEGRIVHTGIILQDNKIIHASGKVRVDRFDHYGIYNTDTKKYSHRLRIIKRYF